MRDTYLHNLLFVWKHGAPEVSSTKYLAIKYKRTKHVQPPKELTVHFNNIPNYIRETSGDLDLKYLLLECRAHDIPFETSI